MVKNKTYVAILKFGKLVLETRLLIRDMPKKERWTLTSNREQYIDYLLHRAIGRVRDWIDSSVHGQLKSKVKSLSARLA